ncbi:maleylpyruvate isomerase N-terminal domain-containing protein [Leucobacter japonicus]|uniref:maleylpyruvate isomerase N-terminal domain-containing protein n=1 Tax=Leucobacter japonicus TaxID=1461259 RepID=UPI0006A7A9A5|nr:maleylpyruvate isomerase N-terminal domain-containing protein [Leucobacter japonicus]
MQIDGIAESRTNFAAAAVWAVEVVDALGDADWEGPGLGAWNLRALVGHTSRALLTVETYLARPTDVEVVRSAEDYYARTLAQPSADEAAVLQRGVDAGAALGADPALAFAEIAARVLRAVRDAGNPVIETIVGGMRLDVYLPTRAFELVVHGLDIQRATAGSRGASSDRPGDPPAEVLAGGLQLAGSLAARGGSGATLLLTLTGRASLPAGYSVLAAPAAAPDSDHPAPHRSSA